jgi:hypothetical protein
LQSNRICFELGPDSHILLSKNKAVMMSVTLFREFSHDQKQPQLHLSKQKIKMKGLNAQQSGYNRPIDLGAIKPSVF